MNYSEEEKEVIDKIEILYKYLDIWKEKFTIVPEDKRYLETVLNLIQKQESIIDKMAEEILKIDIAKSKFEYDHARVWDTEKGIKEYFKKVVDKDVKD